jgi:hypothetical protein
VILISAALVLAAIALLITGVVVAQPYLVMWSIVVSVLSAVCLLIGALLRRHELFPARAGAAAGSPVPPPAPVPGMPTSVPASTAPSATSSAAEAPATSPHFVPPRGAGVPGMAPSGLPHPSPLGAPPAAPPPVPHAPYAVPAPMPAPARAPGPLAADAIVLVIPGRKRFHRPGCRRLAGRDHEELTYEEAREEGFTACTTCDPEAAGRPEPAAPEQPSPHPSAAPPAATRPAATRWSPSYQEASGSRDQAGPRPAQERHAPASPPPAAPPAPTVPALAPDAPTVPPVPPVPPIPDTGPSTVDWFAKPAVPSSGDAPSAGARPATTSDDAPATTGSERDDPERGGPERGGREPGDAERPAAAADEEPGTGSATDPGAGPAEGRLAPGMVTIVPGTRRYHASGCPHLKGVTKAEVMSRSMARAAGLDECADCHKATPASS